MGLKLTKKRKRNRSRRLTTSKGGSVKRRAPTARARRRAPRWSSARGSRVRRRGRFWEGLRIESARIGPKRAAVVASAVVLVAGIAVVLSSAPGWGRSEERFVLSNVEVRGNVVLTEEEIVALSGAETGSNLLDVSVSDLEESVEASARVVRAKAVRVLPDRIIVTVDERLPTALVSTSSGEVLEVSEDGAVLPPVERSAAVDLPLVTGAVGDIEPGIDALSDEVQDALDLLARARSVSQDMWAEISEVKIAPGSGLVIYTVADGAEIRVGSGALATSDLKRLWRVMEDIRLKGRGVESIDLRFKEQVIVRLT